MVSCTVLYAAEIGGCGLDIEEKLSRLDVFMLTRQGVETTDDITLIDVGTPYHPEFSCYAVAEIWRGIYIILTERTIIIIVIYISCLYAGAELLLSADGCGEYTVHKDLTSK